MKRKYQSIWKAAKKELSTSAHGLDHTKRVYELCKKLTDENTNSDVLLPAAILHDIARYEEDNDDTGDVDHAVLGADKAEKILKEIGFEDQQVDEIEHCIKAHRFRSDEEPMTREAKILSDADKLDAIGAVGVARMFMLAGEFQEHLYRDVDTEEYVEENMSENGRVKDISEHSPNLEYELKLKKVPEKLYTEEAKKMARQRLDYMDSFFDRLKEEIEGKI